MKLALAVMFAAVIVPSATFGQNTKNCHLGSYELGNGQMLDIAPSTEDTLRWRLFSGETGQLHPQENGTWIGTKGWSTVPDGRLVSFSSCAKGEINFGPEHGKRLAYDVKATSFDSQGIKLQGRLIMPAGIGKVPVVVLIHGSEHDSALDFNALQRMFPSQGIGAFVYDKRGTGASGGAYTQDFDVLARDAASAMEEARRLAGTRAGRVGYQGGSEAGWVIPLAANRATVDFAIVSFGLAVTILEEDQQSVALDMRVHHHSPEETTHALELARAGERVIETGAKEGYEQFDELRVRYKTQPWFKDVHGDFLFFILPLDKEHITNALTHEFNFVVPFRYEPMPTLRVSRTPQLWILGSDDLEAPSDETARRIRSLIDTGKNFTLAIFSGAEHGMTEYDLKPDGSRLSTRFAPGYFSMMRDYVLSGSVTRQYGSADITRPK